MTEAPDLTIKAIWNFVWAHWYVIGLHLGIIIKGFCDWQINTLDMPTDKDTPRYRWWFRTCNYVALNGKRAAAAAVPGPEDTVRKQTVTTTEKKTTQVVLPTDEAKDK